MKTQERKQFRIIGVEVTTSIPDAPKKCAQAWMDLLEKEKTITRSNKREMFGACFETGECEIRYIAAVEVDETTPIPEGMVEQTIEPATYAVYSHKGKMDKLGETYADIQNTQIPKEGIKPGKWWLEVYDERYKHDQDDSEFDILIPFKP